MQLQSIFIQYIGLFSNFFKKKSKLQRNMCISHALHEDEEKLWKSNLLTEEEEKLLEDGRRNHFFADAKLAGFQDEQLEPLRTLFTESGHFEDMVN